MNCVWKCSYLLLNKFKSSGSQTQQSRQTWEASLLLQRWFQTAVWLLLHSVKFIISIRLHSIFSQEQISRYCLDILTFLRWLKSAALTDFYVWEQSFQEYETTWLWFRRNLFIKKERTELVKHCWSRAFVSLSLIIDYWWLITVLLTAAVLLPFQYSELELALNTLVTEFHKAADNGPTMNTTQFQSMISSQMPAIAKVLMTSQLVFQSQII